MRLHGIPAAGLRRIAQAQFPVVGLDVVYHVGDLDPGSKGSESLEGAGLSVSLHPEEWSLIAKLPGDVWTLTNPTGSFLDALSLNEAQKDEVLQWGFREGYLEPASAWRYSYYDDERGEEVYMSFLSEAEAQAELQDREEGRVEEVRDSFVGTERLSSEGMNSHVEREEDIAFDVLLTLYVEQATDLDGVWWDETLDVGNLSAPRGVIVPSRIGRWEKEAA